MILEDELIVAEEVRLCLESYGYEVVGIAVSKKQAQKFFHEENPDIVLLDINIKGEMAGLDLAEEFRSLRPCVIIFLTAYTDQQTLKRAKDVNPDAYLVKPFDEKNLVISIEVAFNNFLSKEYKINSGASEIDEFVYVRDNNRFIRLDISDIDYIKAARSYCEVLTQSKTYTFTFNLKNFETKVKHKDLIRVHRSFMINKNKVSQIEGNRVLVGKTWIEVGASFRKEVFSQFPML